MVSRAITSDVVSITPKKAQEMLETNEVNRNPRMKTVAAYRRDMEAGRWHFVGDPIRISRTGRLLDGQHRLMALAGCKMNRGVEFLVITGLPDEMQTMMDQGIARNIRDALKIGHGELKNTTLVASISRWLVLAPEISDLTPSSLRNKVTTSEALIAFNQHPEIEYAAARSAHYKAHIPGSPTALGYVWFHLNKLDPMACEEFFNAMVNMSFSVGDDPRKAALRRLQILHRDEEIKTTLETGVMVVSVLTRAWNAWRKSEEVSTINVKSRGGIILPVTPV